MRRADTPIWRWPVRRGEGSGESLGVVEASGDVGAEAEAVLVDEGGEWE